MATITSTATGDWGTGGTWVGGVVPADGDAVVIASGHTVTFNVDQSAWVTGIDGLTITGTLTVSSTTTSYMFMKAAKTINGAGTFNVGTAVTAIPFAVKFTLTGGAGWYINGTSGLTMTVWGTEPTNKTILTSGAEAIGQTEIGVATDVSGDIWAAGDTVRIDDIARAIETEERVIAAGAIASDHIDITAGLTAAKDAGAVVSLITRNVRFVGNGAHLLQSFGSGKLTIGSGEFRNSSTSYYLMTACPGTTISGGAFSGTAGTVFNASAGCTVSGGVFTGATAMFSSGSLNTISGGSFSGLASVGNGSYGIKISGGTFKGITNVILSCPGCFISGGTFSGNTSAVTTTAGFTITGGTFDANTYVFNSSSGVCRNATFSNSATADLYNGSGTFLNTAFSATENSGYATFSEGAYTESFDHDASAGTFRSWTTGGITSSATATLPTGFTTYMSSALASATYLAYWQKEVLVAVGASVTISMALRKSASMSYLPRIIAFLKNTTDPLAGGAGINTFTMTDSTDTWEYSTYSYSNNTSSDVTLIIRSQGKNATGTMLSAVDVDVINVDLTTVLANLATVDTNVDAILLDTGTTGVPLTAAGVDAIWDELTSGHTTAGSFGVYITKKLLSLAKFLGLK